MYVTHVSLLTPHNLLHGALNDSCGIGCGWFAGEVTEMSPCAVCMSMHIHMSTLPCTPHSYHKYCLCTYSYTVCTQAIYQDTM